MKNTPLKIIDKGFLPYYKSDCELTEEEYKIILLTRKKYLIRRIALELHLSEPTVKNRIREINRKLQDKLESLVYFYKSKGWSNFEIGQRIGVNPKFVSKIIDDIINK